MTWAACVAPLAAVLAALVVLLVGQVLQVVPAGQPAVMAAAVALV